MAFNKECILSIQYPVALEKCIEAENQHMDALERESYTKSFVQRFISQFKTLRPRKMAAILPTFSNVFTSMKFLIEICYQM